MSDTVLKYQCPACGAPLEFSSEKQMLVCNSCDSEYPQDVVAGAAPAAEAPPSGGGINWNIEGYVNQQVSTEAAAGFNCTSCGAEVVSDGTTVATECMYCGNPVVMTQNASGMVKPDAVIPFKIDKNRAEQILQNFYKDKPLLPDAFTKDNRISKISGMYVPFWLFSCTGSGTVNFDATKVRRWSDSNYNYTKTEYFELTRSGQIGFDKIPVDASSKMDDNYMDGVEPYEYNDLVAFNSMYMAGYFADKFDVGVGECSERANERVITSTEDAFRKTIQGYSSVSKKTSFVQMYGEDIKYTLFPIWMLNTKYQGKMYQFAINGQTGRIAGELPIDKGKLLKWRIGIALASFIPLTIIALFFL